MTISDLIMYAVGLFLFGILISRTIESVKKNNYERKRKKLEKKMEKALNSRKKYQNNEEIYNHDDIDEQQELENFITDVNDAGFDIDEEEALEYISDGRSSEDYVTYMEDFYQGDDDIGDNESDDDLKGKAEDYINDMNSLGYDITDDDAMEMAEEGFDPEDYAEEYNEENGDND